MLYIFVLLSLLSGVSLIVLALGDQWLKGLLFFFLGVGAIAAANADKVFVTDDNPRHEAAADIRAAILAACPDAIEIGERGEAIAAALDAAQADDLVLLAGKGHESGQIIGDIILPFDDVTMAQTILASKGGHHA